jgi:APA family basic amino acid/polyamine antiporter
LAQSVSPSPVLAGPGAGHLLRILGTGFGIAVMVGATIGSGILRTPGEIAGHLRNYGWILAVWLAGGLYALFGTVSVTELGTMLPQAGGWYVYSLRAFGRYTGFLVGCSDWMVQTVSVSYLAAAFAEFAAELQPRLGGHQKMVGVGILAVLMLLNWTGLRAGSRTQQVTSLIKALALLAFVAACFLIPSHGVASHAAVPAVSSIRSGFVGALILSLQAIVVSYDGWYQAIYFTEEDTNPAANLPRSSIGGVLVCIAIFLLVNMALFYVMPMSRLSTSHVPVADAALALFGVSGRQLVLLFSLVTAVSAINATCLSTPRILFAMAREGLMPRWITFVNKGGTPSVALMIGTLAASALVLSGSFETLISIASFLFVSVYMSGFIALFALRIKEPDLPRPFKAWAYPWGNLGVLLSSAAFLVGTIIADLKDALFTLIFIALTVPLYLLIRMKNGSAANLAGTRSARPDTATAAVSIMEARE